MKNLSGVSILFIIFLIPFFALISSAATTIPSENWAGYTLYYGNNDLSYASAVFDVIALQLPDTYTQGEPIAAALWVGMSQAPNGTPWLAQSGWFGIYNWDTHTFVYAAVIENYPLPLVYVGIVKPGDIVVSEVYAVSGSNGTNYQICIYVPSEDIAKCMSYSSASAAPRYAHFMLETPSINDVIARLPAFTVSERMYNIYTRLYNGVYIPGSSMVAQGTYIKQILEQGSYINADTIFDTSTNSEIIWYITSKR